MHGITLILYFKIKKYPCNIQNTEDFNTIINYNYQILPIYRICNRWDFNNIILDHVQIYQNMFLSIELKLLKTNLNYITNSISFLIGREDNGEFTLEHGPYITKFSGRKFIPIFDTCYTAKKIINVHDETRFLVVLNDVLNYSKLTDYYYTWDNVKCRNYNGVFSTV